MKIHPIESLPPPRNELPIFLVFPGYGPKKVFKLSEKARNLSNFLKNLGNCRGWGSSNQSKIHQEDSFYPIMFFVL